MEFTKLSSAYNCAIIATNEDIEHAINCYTAQGDTNYLVLVEEINEFNHCLLSKVEKFMECDSLCVLEEAVDVYLLANTILALNGKDIVLLDKLPSVSSYNPETLRRDVLKQNIQDKLGRVLCKYLRKKITVKEVLYHIPILFEFMQHVLVYYSYTLGDFLRMVNVKINRDKERGLIT